MKAIDVQRDENGHWTHPEYLNLFGDREIVPRSEFNAWLDAKNLECTYIELECDDNNEVSRSYFDDGDPDISKWQPTPPYGEGWFIASIHDSDDGPVCVWLRNKTVKS